VIEPRLGDRLGLELAAFEPEHHDRNSVWDIDALGFHDHSTGRQRWALLHQRCARDGEVS
jgi:hypothetical protein